jgi:4-oxalomesaconate tautomerase
VSESGSRRALDGVRCMLMRGGTSKGAFFVRDDLPSERAERDELILRIVGSPDPRQIDGLGGGHPLTTKVAVVGPSRDERADVTYLFLQPSVNRALVSDTQNCGNMLAGVGPFAVERRLVQTAGDRATVRILMENTDSVAVASFDLVDGEPRYAGAVAVSGVPGTAAPIRLDFEDVAGSSCGALFPTGAPVDDVTGTPCTLVDYGMPVVVVDAADLGVDGGESPADLEANASLRAALEAIRLAAGPMMNLGDVADATVPKLTIVSAPHEGGSLRTRTFIPHRCHDAIGVLGALTVAVAAKVPGTTAAGRVVDRADGLVALEHPTGTFETVVAVRPGRALEVESAGLVRTARKLMDGVAFPREY